MAEPHNYASSLRVIGQDISKFRPLSLEVQLTGDVFLVSGTSHNLKVQEPPPRGTWNVLDSWIKPLRKKPPNDESQPSVTTFSLRYTPADIDQLDQVWAANRGKTEKTPDLKSLPELLRTVGRYLDSEGNCLVKLIKEDHMLVLYAHDKQGNLKSLECDLMALYRHQQKAISKRETMVIKDLWGERPL